jgi:hypothetical protein
MGDEFFNELSAFLFFDDFFAQQCLGFRVERFKVFQRPVVGFSGKAFVIGIVFSEPFIRIISRVADIKSVEFFRKNNVNVMHRK